MEGIDPPRADATAEFALGLLPQRARFLAISPGDSGPCDATTDNSEYWVVFRPQGDR
jgi:hypothetical protein